MPDDDAFVTLVDGLALPECPRWHDGRLWFSDMHAGRVHAIRSGEPVETIVEVPGMPAGLGWAPDGALLIVSMRDRRLLRFDAGVLSEVADLSELAPFHCNELVTTPAGRSYVGNFGFDLDGGGVPTTTHLICVEPDGSIWVAIEGLFFPNGMVITEAGTLIVAESFGQRLSAYDLAEDGTPTNPRVWADLRPNVPDGICLDAEGAVWIADPVQRGVARVEEGGAVSDWISTGDRGAYACVLGGRDGKTLFVCTASSSDPERTVERRDGRVELTKVKVPAPGF